MDLIYRRFTSCLSVAIVLAISAGANAAVFTGTYDTRTSIASQTTPPGIGGTGPFQLTSTD